MRTEAQASVASTYERDVPRLGVGAPYCLAIFVALRLLISIAGALFVGDHPPDPSAVGPGAPPGAYTQSATPGWHNVADGMQRWDAAWFQWIAEEGYGPDDARGALFPGYPILISLTAFLTGVDAAAASTVVSNIAFAAALVALYALTAYERPTHDAPRRTVLLFAALPTSFFLLAPYSESPFLLASLLAIFWARTDRWGWRVGVASFSACAVRSLGIALVVALVAEALRQRPGGRSQLRRRLPSAAAGLLAPFLYGAWWWSQGESPFHPLQAQAHWHRTPSFPIVTVWHGLEAAWHAVAGAMGSFVFVDAALAVLVLVAATAMWRRLTPTYSIYVWTSLLIPLSYAASWRPLLSVPRFAAVLFPVAWVGEMVVRSRWGFFAVTGLALACQIALAVEFMNWGWIF